MTAVGPMKVLTFTTLYPNAAQPHHGVFVENRLRHLAATGKVDARVVAPVPWFPFAAERFGRYGAFARAPSHETRHGIEVSHPRYLVIPKVGMNLAPRLLYRGALRAVKSLIDNGFDFDLIDAHYFYPDGVAAVMLGERFGKPVTITARGTDINLIAQIGVPGKMIREAAGRAAGVIAVSRALEGGLAGIGVNSDRITVLRNGVDLDLFRPIDRAASRSKFALNAPTLLFVGNLVRLKGHDLVIRALRTLPEVDLLIVGSGPEEVRLRGLARELGVSTRVRFMGPVPHEQLAELYSAADALVLASSREGWPNVLLEAMACGTPVIASNVGGIPEIVATPEAGVLMRERSAEGIADAVRALLSHPPDRPATRRYAERFSWDATTEGQLRLFGSILADRRRAA